MKAQEYAQEFKEARIKHKDQEETLRIIFVEMIREANITMKRIRCTSVTQVASIFEIQNNKWKDMCIYLIKYPINKDGFLELLRDLKPELYLKLIINGLTPLIEDKTILPEGDKNE